VPVFILLYTKGKIFWYEKLLDDSSIVAISETQIMIKQFNTLTFHSSSLSYICYDSTAIYRYLDASFGCAVETYELACNLGPVFLISYKKYKVNKQCKRAFNTVS
jgi:hypothetical protein